MNYNNHGLPYQPKDTPDTIPDPPTSGSNINQESKDNTKETWYHFIFNDGTFYNAIYAASFKGAIRELSKFYGNNSEMFRKCLKGYDETDVDGMVTVQPFCIYRYWRNICD